MASHLLFVAIIGTIFATALTGVTGQLRLLGTSYRKSFYADWNVLRDWVTAKEFCSRNGMQLATITTPGEQGLLLSRANNETFVGGFWTDGRDSHRHSQFVWDLDGETVTPFSVRRMYVSIPYQSCLMYALNANTYRYDEFQPRPCSQRQGTLCQLVR